MRYPSRDYWVLIGHEPMAVDLDTWVKWVEEHHNDSLRRVGDDTVKKQRVSTVFLMLDHNFGFGLFGDDRPILFETMIFGGTHDQAMWRYATWDEAEAGHRRIVAALKAGLDPTVDLDPDKVMAEVERIMGTKR